MNLFQVFSNSVELAGNNKRMLSGNNSGYLISVRYHTVKYLTKIIIPEDHYEQIRIDRSSRSRSRATY